MTLCIHNDNSALILTEQILLKVRFLSCRWTSEPVGALKPKTKRYKIYLPSTGTVFLFRKGFAFKNSRYDLAPRSKTEGSAFWTPQGLPGKPLRRSRRLWDLKNREIRETSWIQDVKKGRLLLSLLLLCVAIYIHLPRFFSFARKWGWVNCRCPITYEPLWPRSKEPELFESSKSPKKKT